MPTYQYVCKSCGEGLEAVQGFHDAPLTDCPACSGPLRKVFSSVGVVFKGSGFYRTDSRAASKAGGSSSSGPGDAAPAASAPAGGAGDGSAARAGSKGPEPAKKPTKPASSGSTSAA